MKATHNAAADFVDSTGGIVPGLVVDTNGNALPLSKTRPRMEHALDVFEFNVIVASTHLPPQVQRYLTAVRKDLDEGREQLRAARDPTDLLNRIANVWGDGKRAYGFASDLVGTACGTQLGV